MTRASALIVESPAGPIPREWALKSPFAGLDVCCEAGWDMWPDGPRPVFDEDFWDLSGVKFPKGVRSNVKRLDFTGITNPALRLTAKEYVFALVVPDHERVLALPGARRDPYKPESAFNFCVQLVRWMNFVTDQGMSSLCEVMQEHCEVYREFRSHRSRKRRQGSGPITPGTMLTILRPVVDLAAYRELFTVDAYRPGFTPWEGHTVSEVAGWETYALSSTPPVTEEVFQPTVAAALYLVETLGPLVAEELERLLEARASKGGQSLREITSKHRAAVTAALDRLVLEQVPLLAVDARQVTRRIKRGWRPDDPLLHVDVGDFFSKATRSRYVRIADHLVEDLRPLLEPAVAKAGVAGAFGREASRVPSADDSQHLVPWTLALTGDEVRSLQFVLLAACRVLVAALSGMRAGELDELTADSPQPPVTVSGGTQRFKLSSKLIKGQEFGGVAEEWVVLEPAWRAVKLAARLNQDRDGQRAFARSPTDFLHKKLREWVNSPAGQRLGLAPIPAGPVNGRMLRRTLALSLAHRPGGLLAAKIHLKHVSVVTTEGYANRPGGSQGNLLAEVEREQEKSHLKLTKEAFADYRAGRMPTGPGARELIKAFEHIDAQIKDHEPGTAAVLEAERRLENLLRQQSKHLHLQTANYCWFRDPHKALCLKLAGTPDATKPLGGMCDSARCPQATHHPCHLPVWQSQVGTGKVFLANPRFPKGEKRRLEPEVERAERVVDEIMTAAGTSDGGE
ncbi:conserved hypothetical protein [Streptomyces himastatinicus ATCC 53653]|uniref:Integrase n=1 Tax=Streptomyces himastatinicus ATCC 53653 TaxID=457427 RepID=D9WBM3_9ACTN|nr:conserved hypothetical protein [Streptomyces himastatinicus ATCC 53653]